MTKDDERKGGEERVPRAWDRTARLLGTEAMRRLAGSHVAVFGLGGVGSYAVEGLVRSGVGSLTLVDFDRVCVTNINRQLHAFPSTVGRSKAELMADHARAINPSVSVRAECAFYEAATSESLLSPAPDYVVDAIDNVTAKLHLIASCLQRGIKVVTCLGAAAKADPTSVRVSTLGNTHMDRLARAIRRNLKKKYGLDEAMLDKVLAVFSNEDIAWPDASYGGLVCGVNCVCPSGEDSRHSCSRRHVIHGSAVFVTAVFGMTAAGVVVRELTERFPVEKQGYVIRERRLRKVGRVNSGSSEQWGEGGE
jgi:tRNA A37 threonylcarbamoyladenosine dehydratase